jgi:transposase
MIGPAGSVRVYIACGVTDMRRGFDTLAAQVQTMLQFDPHNGALYAFRGRRGDMIKILWWDGQGLCLFSKRLERGKFIWPQAKDGSVLLTPAQLSMLVEGIDWRAPTASREKTSPRSGSSARLPSINGHKVKELPVEREQGCGPFDCWRGPARKGHSER